MEYKKEKNIEKEPFLKTKYESKQEFDFSQIKEKDIKEEKMKSSIIPVSFLNQVISSPICICQLNFNFKKGTGFFLKINIKEIPFKICLITASHVLNEEEIKPNNKIEINYKENNISIKKIIIIGNNRRFITNKTLDYTCIELFQEDRINNFFNIDTDTLEEIKEKDIYIFYPHNDSPSLSQGKIVSINNYKIWHNCYTELGSTGSPILSYNSLVIGIHLGQGPNKEINIGILIKDILEDIKIKCQISEEKFEYDPQKSMLNCIIN